MDEIDIGDLFPVSNLSFLSNQILNIFKRNLNDLKRPLQRLKYTLESYQKMIEVLNKSRSI